MKITGAKKDALTTGEIAKYCGVNFRTVIRWIDKGYLESYKLPGRGDNRVPLAKFIEFLKANGMPIPEELQLRGNDTTAKEDSPGSPPRILIVEDEEPMAKAIYRTLAPAKYTVEFARNGVEAGTRLESFKPDLITLDLHMPGMSGFEILEMLKQEKKYHHIKVLVISAAGQTQMLQAMQLGAHIILEKPFDNDALFNHVQQILRQ